MDFILWLPRTQRGVIFVVFDRFSKMTHFFPWKKTFFFSWDCAIHGIPKSITSDWDVKFVSHFLRILLRCFNTSLKFSSAYHLQTDGQTEVVNRTVGNMLHSLVGEHPKKWDLFLPQAEFSYNNMPNRSTKFSSFQIVYTKVPNNTFDLLPSQKEMCRKANTMSKDIINISDRVKQHLQQANT